MMKKILMSIILFLSFLSFSDYKNELLKAIETDNLSEIKLLEVQKRNIEIKDNIMGKNILAYAIYNNSDKIAKYLIENKKYKYMINEISNDKTLAIEDAVLKENEQILKLLLENGAIIRKKDGNNMDVYELATKFGKGRMVKILRDYELENEK
ncbi:ankyrin [Oceanivirga miroungae]|uniref:Ankyrin n=2 Tax=Oceanivirga miroungae TaxID=1130046 RepID=A0A6I8MD37_9FUSO|nr:ankyrin [Oceanivirga miroungae]